MRGKLLRLFQKSERAVDEAMLRVERQRAIVSSMDKRTPGADVASLLLRKFERNLDLLTAHRDQLLRMVEEII